MTNACNKLVLTGPEVRARPLQYTNTPQIELDSYVTLTQAVRMRVCLIVCVCVCVRMHLLSIIERNGVISY